MIILFGKDCACVGKMKKPALNSKNSGHQSRALQSLNDKPGSFCTDHLLRNVIPLQFYFRGPGWPWRWRHHVTIQMWLPNLSETPCFSGSHSVPLPLGLILSLLSERYSRLDKSNISQSINPDTQPFTRILPIITRTHPITTSALCIFVCTWPQLFLLTILWSIIIMILADKGSRLREAKRDFSCPNHLM